MKAIFATLLLSETAANYSFGACKPFQESGIPDVSLNTGVFGTDKWLNKIRTSWTYDGQFSDCPHSYFKYENDRLQEYRL